MEKAAKDDDVERKEPMTKTNRNDRLALRREAKFARHKMVVKPEATTEERERTVTRFNPNTEKQEQTKERYQMHFTHAVYAGAALVGRTRSWRSALKRAHQECKNRRGR